MLIKGIAFFVKPLIYKKFNALTMQNKFIYYFVKRLFDNCEHEIIEQRLKTRENLRLYKRIFQRVNIKAHYGFHNLINFFVVIISL